MFKFLAAGFLNLLLCLSINAQNEIIVDLINLEMCDCIKQDSAPDNIDDFIAVIESCIETVVEENQSTIEEAWDDSTKVFSIDMIDEDFGRMIGEKLSVSCPAFLERIQIIQNNSLTSPPDTSSSELELMLYANELMETDSCEEAIDSFSRIIKSPTAESNYRVTAYNNRGVCRNEIGDYYRAISDFYVALEMNPNFYLAYVNLGESKNLIGDYKSAIDDLNYSIEHLANEKNAYGNRGFAYYNLGFSDKALEDFHKALSLDSLYEDSYFGLASVYLYEQIFDSALTYFNKLESINPSYPDLSYYISNSYIGKGDTLKAIESLKNDQLTDIDYINLNEIGLMYYGIKEFDSAAVYYSKSIEIDSTSSQIYLNRGYAYQDSEKHLQAVKDFSKVISLDITQSGQAYLFRGISKLELHSFEEAISDFDQAISINENRAEAYDYRARSYIELEQYENAISDFSKSINIYNDPKIFLERGEVYLVINNKEQACKDFRTADLLESSEAGELLMKNCTSE